MLIRSVGFHEHRYVKLRVAEKAHEAVVSSFILGQTMTIITGVSAWFNVREVCFNFSKPQYFICAPKRTQCWCNLACSRLPRPRSMRCHWSYMRQHPGHHTCNQFFFAIEPISRGLCQDRHGNPRRCIAVCTASLVAFVLHYYRFWPSCRSPCSLAAVFQADILHLPLCLPLQIDAFGCLRYDYQSEPARLARARILRNRA